MNPLRCACDKLQDLRLRRLVRLLEHAHTSENFPLELLITVTFEEQEGRTKMVLRHAGMPLGADRDGARQGWTESFDKVAEYLREATERRAA